MTVIITGASSGIGLACANKLGETHSLVLVSKTLSKLFSAAKQITNWTPANHKLVSGDVGDPDVAARSVEAAKTFGPITTLICSAGIGKSAATEASSLESWTEIFNTNVNGAFNFARACLPEMLASGGGTIILISSVSGLVGIKRNAAYTASKHALIGFAKSLAAEHGKRGLVVVPICPGFVETPMTERTIAGLAAHRGISLEAARAVVAGQSAQNRIIPVAEVAELVAFIASGKCKSLSGHEIVMSGGGL